MSARKERSKKRSGANSKPPPESFTYNLDRNLGKHIIAMRASGLRVEVHDYHLPIDSPDEDWIALVGRRGWIAITKDKNIRYRYAEIEAIKKHRARIIVVRAKNATGSEIASTVVKFTRRLQNFARRSRPPFIIGLDRSGSMSRYL